MRVSFAWGRDLPGRTSPGRDVIDEDAYLQALSFQTGLAIETFAEISRSDCPLPDRYLSRVAQHGLLPLRQRGQLLWVVAPRGFTARRLCRLAAAYSSLRDRVLLTSKQNLDHFLLRQEAGDALGRSAANALGRRFPALSAAPVADDTPRGRGMRTMRRLAETVLLERYADADGRPGHLEQRAGVVVPRIYRLAARGQLDAAALGPEPATHSR